MFLDKFTNAEEVFTFSDMILLPGKTSIAPWEPDVQTQITNNWRINIPLVSSPMDTVTETQMAISLARCGGMGVLHRNCSIEDHVEMARQVKRAESFIIRDVITTTPDTTVKELKEAIDQYKISGFPVVDKAGDLVGIVTLRDVRFASEVLTVRDVMSKLVITASEETSLEDAKKLMHEHRIEKLPIEREGKLVGLITLKDLDLRGKFPNSSRDEEGRLLCAAGISPFDKKRAEKLDRFVDIFVCDVAHAHNEDVMRAVKSLAASCGAALIYGNIGTSEAAEEALTRLERLNGFRVGLGSGSTCKTSVVTKAAAPTLYATARVAETVYEYGALEQVPIIADGGIRNPGDASLALAAGASAVMMGNIFASCRESPGRLVALEGKYWKTFRGMASQAAMQKRFAIDRYGHTRVPEGVEGFVPFRGPVKEVVSEFIAGIKASFAYCGAKTIADMWKKARFGKITFAGIKEMQPHDILMPGKAETS